MLCGKNSTSGIGEAGLIDPRRSINRDANMPITESDWSQPGMDFKEGVATYQVEYLRAVHTTSVP